MASRENVVRTVGVKELKNRLTRYLCRVKLGEEIVITKPGTPTAVIRPIQSAAPVVSLQARLAKLAAQGLVTLPTRKPLKGVRTVKVSGPPISRTILEDRR
jgi:prevent-host-death family protein